VTSRAATSGPRFADPLRPAVDVVILAWNDQEVLDQAVGSALDSVGVEVRVWVIDNGSNPPARVVSDPRVKLYRNPKNLGVAAARNQGVRVGHAPYVCLLDSDARLHPNTLAVLAGALQDDRTLGLVGPVYDGQPPEATAGSVPTVLRLVARVRRARGSEAGDRRTVDWVSGACQVFGREAFNYTGGFDEYYFFGPEAVDFCLRIREAGLRVEQVMAAHCAHEPRNRTGWRATDRGPRVERKVGLLDTVVVGARQVARQPSGLSARRRSTRAATGR
jgi:GT2 family glycosyltransferase